MGQTLGQTHWWTRIFWGAQGFQVNLTGFQVKPPGFQVKPPGFQERKKGGKRFALSHRLDSCLPSPLASPDRYPLPSFRSILRHPSSS
jgi:hypothetical protein